MKISGVYEIINTINGHRYIGSADNMRVRWNLHKQQLNKGNHHSPYLQRAWNKYGEKSFKFNLLVLANEKNYRLLIEQGLIDQLMPEYNVCPKAHSRLGAKTRPETIIKLKKIGKSLSSERRAQMRANMLNTAIPAAAEWHKTKSGSEWHKQHYQKMKHLLHAKHKIVCDQCGIEYYAEKGRFCSNACKSKWRRNNGLDNVMRKCVVCGSEFVTNKYSDTVTCSRSCGRTLGWRSAEGE